MLDRLRRRHHDQKPNTLDLLESASRRTPGRGASGSRFWLLPTILLISAVMVIPIIWIGLARVAGIPLGTVSDLSGLLATIGGVMGAIFAVGGLVIALVSVVTLLSIEDRVQATIGQLQPGLDERANLQIEANIAYLRATGERDWRVAQRLTREALQKWPDITGVRSFLAQRMANDVTKWFYQERLNLSKPSSPWRVIVPVGNAADYVLSTVQQAESVSPPYPAYRIEDPPLVQAILWLEDAIAHGEDTRGELRAQLALMYGVNRQRPEMTEALEEALRTNPDLRDYLGSSDCLPMLAYAFTTTFATSPALQTALVSLGKLLDLTLPVASDQVTQAVVAARTSVLISNENAFWVAIKKAELGGASAQDSVMSLLHFLVTTGPAGTVGVADWMIGRPQQKYFPKDRTNITVEELVAELDKEYFFICAR